MLIKFQAYIVGEHGDSSVALWSSISVGGVPILSFLKRQQIAYEKETLENIHKEVVQSAYEVIRLKGYTSWAIGYSVASLARTLLRDQRRIHPVSVLAKGFYDIDGGEVFLSLPAQLGRNGVLGVANVHLTDEEAQQLRNSAKTILEVQSQLGI
ncbi:UNVERIFIED_CONTAM: L-lactate dehydrogenase B [Sesamum radiatum]|uniref:L-lactate dehydrogenase n=1 Tax=Sesamum radiatum TaxID=300843 RepID=A0AAW2L2P4_SESRA